MEVKIENLGACELPSYESESAAGMDVRANIQEPMIIPPQAFKLIPTGLGWRFPKGRNAKLGPEVGWPLNMG